MGGGVGMIPRGGLGLISAGFGHTVAGTPVFSAETPSAIVAMLNDDDAGDAAGVEAVTIGCQPPPRAPSSFDPARIETQARYRNGTWPLRLSALVGMTMVIGERCRSPTPRGLTQADIFRQPPDVVPDSREAIASTRPAIRCRQWWPTRGFADFRSLDAHGPNPGVLAARRR